MVFRCVLIGVQLCMPGSRHNISVVMSQCCEGTDSVDTANHKKNICWIISACQKDR